MDSIAVGPRRLLAVLAVLAAALVSAGPAAAAPATFEASFEALCTPTDRGLEELSGLAFDGDVMYAIGDSGTDDKLAVLDSDCSVTRWLTVPVDPYDIEDLQFAGGALWLSDTGDNRQVRDTVALTRMSPVDGAGELHRLTYPDGKHDAEALLIEASGRPVIVSKELIGIGAVYVPAGDVAVNDLPSPGPSALVEVGPLPWSGPVTGGAVSADGKVAALRTYGEVYLYWAADGDIAKALTSGPGTQIAVPRQPQGEAVAFTPAGDLVIASEASAGPLPPLQILRGASDLVRPADATESTTSGEAATGWGPKWWAVVALGVAAVVGIAIVWVRLR
ncbi:hypothetical protein [Antrihabitans stalagmiti]|uniref:hypothetical protein n=1 Tax=Antrihabitans stalagmiti TaxID=2799499 RepID=UPI0027DDC509|nr:hypothetical protein [Antrihabitans stalagmiti]